MLDFMNPLGLPVKYAILGAIALVAGVYLSGLLGMNIAMSYLSAAITGVIGGAVGGYLRQKQGKTN